MPRPSSSAYTTPSLRIDRMAVPCSRRSRSVKGSSWCSESVRKRGYRFRRRRRSRRAARGSSSPGDAASAMVPRTLGPPPRPSAALAATASSSSITSPSSSESDPGRHCVVGTAA